MRDYQHGWENYIRVLEKRAIGHPVQWVVATTLFSFVAGLNTFYALFGGHFPRHLNVVVVIYVVLTSYICVAMFGFTLVRVLRRQQNRSGALPRIENSGHSL